MELTIILITFVTLSAAAAYLCMKRFRELRSLLEFAQTQIDELQDIAIRSRDICDATLQRSSDQARRIAWLESRMRKPKPASSEVLDDTIITETPKLSMTERRHQVINLAGRGRNVDSIATTLGLFKGEVELILNLNQAAAAGAR